MRSDWLCGGGCAMVAICAERLRDGGYMCRAAARWWLYVQSGCAKVTRCAERLRDGD
jgi:hypothetical protein